jgi:glutamyl-tRNA reductase
MTPAQTVPIALVTHARAVGARERVRFAREARARLGGGSVILETCHRVEVYSGTPVPAVRSLEARLPEGGRALIGGAAIRHIIEVAVGRDSVVVGEDQVLHQLRETSAMARRADPPDPTLERLIAAALRAGRRARSWQRSPRRSLADVALAMIERRAGSLNGRDILVVGAGTMGRLAVRASRDLGASVSVASRSFERAQELAVDTGAIAVPFDPGTTIDRFGAVVVALAGPWRISLATMTALAENNSTIVDLSVPAALPEQLHRALDQRLIEADDMARDDISGELLPERALARLDGLVDATTEEIVKWLEQRDSRSIANALVERADRERAAELIALSRRLPELEPETLQAIDTMTRHLAARLLREPLERLGHDSDGKAERAVREIFAL